MSEHTAEKAVTDDAHDTLRSDRPRCTVSAQSGPDVAGLLAEHVLYPRVGGVSCHGCEWQSWEDGGTHEEHLDRLIRGAYADWLESNQELRVHVALSWLPDGNWDLYSAEQRAEEISYANAALTALADLLRGQA